MHEAGKFRERQGEEKGLAAIEFSDGRPHDRARFVRGRHERRRAHKRARPAQCVMPQ